nr:unnamed protein product [Callosobruchus analis]
MCSNFQALQPDEKSSALLEAVTNILPSTSIDIKAEKVANDLDIAIKKPSITKHQITRSNVATSSVKEYYKISINFRYIDSLISLNTRFSDDNNPEYFYIIYLHTI